MVRPKVPTILLVSDGRAETAKQVLKAAAVQFHDQEYRYLRRSNVRTPEEVTRVVKEAEKLGAVIFYTLVSNEMREAMRKASGRNVPLLPDRDPPPQLFRIPRNRVIGLRINVIRLLRVREARIPVLGLEDETYYVDQRTVANEVNNANRLMDRQKWNTIDVSYLAVEEIAGEIMNLRWPRERRI